jgi:hypothetical protein
VHQHASFLGISQALHLDLFDQPVRFELFITQPMGGQAEQYAAVTKGEAERRRWAFFSCLRG